MILPLPPLAGGKTLSERIGQSLREAIISGHFEPGEKIDPDLIAEQYDVSRTPVREALGRLESEGFIELRPHYGAYITTVTEDEIFSVFEIRILLETEIVRQVTMKIPDSVLSKLQERQKQALTNSRDGGYRTHFYKFDIEFHDTLLQYVDNNLFKVVLDTLNNRVSKVRSYAQVQQGTHMVEALEEHLVIIEAMIARDPQRASKLMRQHLEESANRIRTLVPVHVPSSKQSKMPSA